MKKSILFSLLLFISVNVLAGVTATLQFGETMKAFYGDSAFIKAYSEAQDGAIITLSSGRFNDVDTISKSITLIGAYAFDKESSEATLLNKTVINADNVKIEGIYFSYIELGEISNCHLKRCWIYAILQANAFHNNTIVEQCLITQDQAIQYGLNYCLKNCTIGKFSAKNDVNNVAYITNCYIKEWSAKNLLTNVSTNTLQPFAIYKNNIIGLNIGANTGFTYLSIYCPSEFYNNYFYRYCTSSTSTNYYITCDFDKSCITIDNTNSGNKSIYLNSNQLQLKMDTTSFGVLGIDGTPIGITGGDGFSEYPAIPRITSKVIDSNTDSEGKINVRITIQAQQ